MNSANIKSILDTAAWGEIEAFLLKKVKAETGIEKIKTDKRFEDIAIEVMALKKARTILKNALSQLRRQANNTTENNESYI
jgi:predicted  nucleic acid-binding Zn-ribbon protein